MPHKVIVIDLPDDWSADDADELSEIVSHVLILGGWEATITITDGSHVTITEEES